MRHVTISIMWIQQWNLLFWFIDKFTNYMGLIFVILVTILTSSVVILWYMFLRPVILTYSATWIILHFVYAHYLLMNITFHYYKGVFTSPGIPPQSAPIESIRGAVVCKKCIQPKPPRAHHCSICNKCYLKMDHHCPWMNNCIGFYNHRYFVSFCIFMWLGTIYVSTSCFDLFTYHFWHPGTLLDPAKRDKSLVFIPGIGEIIQVLMNRIQINGTSNYMGGLEKMITDYRTHPAGSEDVSSWEHMGIIYLFLITASVTIALSALNLWHMMLILRGETSIEVHINSSEQEKAAIHGMGYNNPYSHGWRNNLRFLLGLRRDVTILNVLFPSAHHPAGDGITWPNNKKPVHYPDPLAYEKYTKSQRFNIFRICCRC